MQIAGRAFLITGGASGLGAAPLSEQALVAYNASGPAVKLAALYVQPSPPALDYPYAVMPGVASDRARLADDPDHTRDPSAPAPAGGWRDMARRLARALRGS